MNEYIKISNLEHNYGNNTVFKAVNISLNKGETFCILGPSGGGKTTLIQCIAGFEHPINGSIIIDDRVIYNKNKNIPPEERNIGLMFQNASLFPHMNVAQNITYGLYKLSNHQKNCILQEFLSLMELEEFEDKYPHELSGGEQQRVALARAIAPNPKLLLMDEPFSNLDTTIKEKLLPELKNILTKKGTTTIFITHDQEEAIEIGDRIAILHNNVIHQIDTPKNLIYNPKTIFVANFFGTKNFLPARYDSNNKQANTVLGKICIKNNPNGENIDIYIPPNTIKISNNYSDNSLKGKITKKISRKEINYYDIMIASINRKFISIPYAKNLSIGDIVDVQINIEGLENGF